METRNQITECGRTIDDMIAELTRVESTETKRETVFLYGRPQWTGPTLHKAASVWLIWKPFAKRPGEKIVTLLKGSFTATREGESPDHLIEIPKAHAVVLDLEEFVLPDESVERVRRTIREQRSF